MKKDAEVLRYMRERRKGTNQELAAARAGMSVKTARKYERGGLLPSQLKQPRTWRTRPNPFEEDWPWVVEQLQRDPALQGATLFAELCQRHPGRYRPTQVRTLQRQIAQWRAQQGPEQEVIFEQVHVPGERAQSDFTHMSDLQVTINGQAFPHLLYHFVLTYSNVEAVRVCFGETFEALAEGIEQALWQLGGVPAQHRTDHLSAAVRHLPSDEQEAFSERYQALMRHYGMQPTWNNAGVAHENGDVEQSHFRFKEALDQALRVRGSREFSSRACIGYLGHPFEKEAPGLSSPASFSLSGGTQPSIEEGNGSRSPEKTRVYGQKTIREGMQWLHERSAQDLSRHDATSWMDLVHQLGVRICGPASGCPAVVMVQPTHDRTSNHLVACMMRGHG